MKVNPLVSIIIPTYNRAHLIGETLDSILMQTHSNWECIVVDDGSTDNTEEFINSYVHKDSRFQYHQRPKERPKGGNAARNYGFELSKGEYINWFDDDDVMLEDFILKKVNSFSSEEVHLVICSLIYVNDKLKEIEKIDLEIKTFLFKEYVLWNLKITTNSILFRKDFLENKKLFDLNIFRGQENEFFSRLFFNLKEDQYKIVNTPLFLYRQHINTISEKNKLYVAKYKESHAYIFSRNLERSLNLKDEKLSNFFYSLLIKLYFESFKFGHKKNRIYISKEMRIFFLRYMKLFETMVIINILTICNFGSYRIYKYLIGKEICFKKHVNF